jgi:hypothetical protein
MAEKKGIEKTIDKVVAQVLESQLPQLRAELVRQVVDKVAPHLGEPAGAGAADLLKGISAIHAGSTQREILRALLDSTVFYCKRSALFVIKSGTATGWQGRAFTDSDQIKDFALEVSSGVAARALETRIPVAGTASEMDSRFISQFGAPSDDQVLVLPLLLKDKVAALVYADAGDDGTMDSSALELLVVSAGAWLEVASLRKQAQKEGTTEAAAAPAPPESVSKFNDPFAGHAPAHAVAAAPEPEPVAVEAPVVVAEPSVAASAAAAAAPATDPFAQMSPEDADVHRKAQRFARLLVDEIKLYNQVKVTEGRKHKDLYDRLKEDIEKSNATYKKRYGNTVAAQGDYFYSEVVRSLAEDDASIMGSSFRR